MKYDIDRAIDLGKIWMKNSVDPVHDYIHAENVEKHALEIYKYFKKIDSTLSIEMVKLAVWWHDSYKSRCKKPSIYSVFFEGLESVKIFEREVGNLVDEVTLKRVKTAIMYHANPVYFTIFKYHMDPIVNVLVEADQLEGYRIERNMKFLKQLKNPLVRFMGIIQCLLIPIYIKLVGRSDYIAKFKGMKTI